METKTCECGREFLVGRRDCHCSPRCCTKYDCASLHEAKRPVGRPRTTAPVPAKDRKCRVCGAHRDRFERFAPCTAQCKGRIFFRSSKAAPELGDGMFRRRWVSRCHLYEDLQGHQPATKARFHLHYCSLRCYNSLSDGHETREKSGRQVRQRRYAGTEARKSQPGSFREEMAALRNNLAAEGTPWHRVAG